MHRCLEGIPKLCEAGQLLQFITENCVSFGNLKKKTIFGYFVKFLDSKICNLSACISFRFFDSLIDSLIDSRKGLSPLLVFH